MEQRERDAYIYPACFCEEGLSALAIMESALLLLIRSSASIGPPPSGSEEAGLTSCAIVGGSSISVGKLFTVPANRVKMVSAGEAEAGRCEKIAPESENGQIGGNFPDSSLFAPLRRSGGRKWFGWTIMTVWTRAGSGRPAF